MDKNKLEYILSKNARVMYFDRSKTLEELESIKEQLDLYHPGYKSFAQGIIYSVQSDLESSITYCNQALEHGYNRNDIFIIEEVSLFLGVIYRSLSNEDEALKCCLNALKYAQNPRVYNNIADIFITIEAYDEGEKYLNKAMDILTNREVEEEFDDLLRTIVKSNLAEVLVKKGDVEKGIIAVNESMVNAADRQDLFSEAYGYGILGLAHTKLKDFNKAIEYLNEAHRIYLSCDTFSQNRVFDYIEDIIRYKSKVYNAWGKYIQSNLELDKLGKFKKEDYLLKIDNFEKLELNDELNNIHRAFIQFLQDEDALDKKERFSHMKSRINVHESEKKATDYELRYNLTKSISEIGRLIFAADKLEDVLHILYDHIDQMMDFDSLLLATVEDDLISYNWGIEDDQDIKGFTVDKQNYNSFSAWVVRNKESIRINDFITPEELKRYKRDSATNFIGTVTDSMLLAPIMYNDDIYGLINIQSKSKYAYSDNELEIVRMLSSFIAVAMKNWNSANELKVANEKLQTIYKTDALTGISNRHLLSETVEQIFENRESDKMLSVVMIDIDHFKEYNDTYGHLEGDKCIMAIVEVLKTHLDNGVNHLFRYGGDEFVALMPHEPTADVVKILDNVRAEIEGLSINHEGSEVSDYVTCSFGFTTVSPNDYEYKKSFYLADEALYVAKAKGKNKIAKK